MGAPRASLLQAREELRDLSRRPDVPPRVARAADWHLTDFTLASFNAHWGTGRFGPGSKRARYDVAEVVRGFEADVVVVLESWREHDGRGVLDDLVNDGYQVETLPLATMVISSRRSWHDDPGEGLWELAICSRFPIAARRDLPIGRIHADPAGERSALMCTLDVDGEEVDLIAVHVSSRLWTLAPIRHLRRLLPLLPPRGRTAVIAGDFNFWGPGVVAVFRGWRRAVFGSTYPAHRPHSQIDHVLVRDNVTVLKGEVLAKTPSDHRPVRVRLRVRPSASPENAGVVG